MTTPAPGSKTTPPATQAAGSQPPVPGSFDDLFRITCAKCQGDFPALDWTRRPITGDLPQDCFQCPGCGDAWRREPNTKPWAPGRNPPMMLTPIPGVL